MSLTIAIDGPVGAGKSSIAKGLAQALSILHLDTGAMYRALAFKALREGVDPEDHAAAEALCHRTRIEVTQGLGSQHTYLDGEDVTDSLRLPEVSAAAAPISAAAGVRAYMVALQQTYAKAADMVLDGRDIGTRVLPHATHKFFLTAPAAVRAKRRYEEQAKKGVPCTYEGVLSELITRDYQDSHRAVDPLRQAEDAIAIDTEHMSEAQVIETLLAIIKGE